MRRVLRVVLWGVGVLAVVGLAFVTWYEPTSYSGGDAQTTPVLLTGATVLAGPELDPLESTSVLVEDGLIVAVGEEADAAAGAGAEGIDLAGMPLMPGLIDLHVHLGTPSQRCTAAPCTREA